MWKVYITLNSCNQDIAVAVTNMVVMSSKQFSRVGSMQGPAP